MSDIEESADESADESIGKLKENLETEREGQAKAHEAPGSAVLTGIFLLCFALYYFANWFALADVWHVR